MDKEVETLVTRVDSLGLDEESDSPPPLALVWNKLQCEEYRTTILNRMQEKPHMTLDDDPPMKNFIFKLNEEPLSLYRTIHSNTPDYDMENLKQNAFQQIGVICELDEPMSLGTILRDFSPESGWNLNLPERTRELFTYIVNNAQDLVDEMVRNDLLEHVILQY